jgi:hypothetical protein
MIKSAGSPLNSPSPFFGTHSPLVARHTPDPFYKISDSIFDSPFAIPEADSIDTFIKTISSPKPVVPAYQNLAPRTEITDGDITAEMRNKAREAEYLDEDLNSLSKYNVRYFRTDNGYEIRAISNNRIGSGGLLTGSRKIFHDYYSDENKLLARFHVDQIKLNNESDPRKGAGIFGFDEATQQATFYPGEGAPDQKKAPADVWLSYQNGVKVPGINNQNRAFIVDDSDGNSHIVQDSAKLQKSIAGRKKLEKIDTQEYQPETLSEMDYGLPEGHRFPNRTFDIKFPQDLTQKETTGKMLVGAIVNHQGVIPSDKYKEKVPSTGRTITGRIQDKKTKYQFTARKPKGTTDLIIGRSPCLIHITTQEGAKKLKRIGEFTCTPEISGSAVNFVLTNREDWVKDHTPQSGTTFVTSLPLPGNNPVYEKVVDSTSPGA